MPAEPVSADELTAEESATLAEAMCELAEGGQHDAATELGKLAADPAELRKVLEETTSAETT